MRVQVEMWGGGGGGGGGGGVWGNSLLYGTIGTRHTCDQSGNPERDLAVHPHAVTWETT